MVKPTLSILICHLNSRGVQLERLRRCLDFQLPGSGEVEVLVESDNGEMSIGKKRNVLLGRAKGGFTCFIDDDDTVVDTYVASILSAIREDPGIDVVGMKGIITFAGKDPATFVHSITCPGWVTRDGVYLRTPNHINPVASYISKSFPFEEIDFGEDHKWSNAILPSLKTERLIGHPIYNYLFAGTK